MIVKKHKYYSRKDCEFESQAQCENITYEGISKQRKFTK